MPGMYHLSYEVLRPQTWQTFFNKTQNIHTADRTRCTCSSLISDFPLYNIYYTTCCSYWYTYLYLSNSH